MNRFSTLALILLLLGHAPSPAQTPAPADTILWDLPALNACLAAAARDGQDWATQPLAATWQIFGQGPLGCEDAMAAPDSVTAGAPAVVIFRGAAEGAQPDGRWFEVSYRTTAEGGLFIEAIAPKAQPVPGVALFAKSFSTPDTRVTLEQKTGKGAFRLQPIPHNLIPDPFSVPRCLRAQYGPSSYSHFVARFVVACPGSYSLVVRDPLKAAVDSVMFDGVEAGGYGVMYIPHRSVAPAVDRLQAVQAGEILAEWEIRFGR